MGRVTDMVLYVGSDLEEEGIRNLNAWCAEHDEVRHQKFAELDKDAAGGQKFSAAQVWAMVGHFFPFDELAEALPSFGWRHPGDVLLIVDDEETDGVQVYRPSPG